MPVFVTAVMLVCVAAPAKNAHSETKRRALVGCENDVRLPKMRVFRAKDDPWWCWKDYVLFIVQRQRESSSEVRWSGYEELLRWCGRDCRYRSCGSDDWGFRTRWRGVRDAIPLCYDLHLLAKSSKACANTLDDCWCLLAKRALRAS